MDPPEGRNAVARHRRPPRTQGAAVRPVFGGFPPTISPGVSPHRRLLGAAAQGLGAGCRYPPTTEYRRWFCSRPGRLHRRDLHEGAVVSRGSRFYCSPCDWAQFHFVMAPTPPPANFTTHLAPMADTGIMSGGRAECPLTKQAAKKIPSPAAPDGDEPTIETGASAFQRHPMALHLPPWPGSQLQSSHLGRAAPNHRPPSAKAISMCRPPRCPSGRGAFPFRRASIYRCFSCEGDLYSPPKTSPSSTGHRHDLFQVSDHRFLYSRIFGPCTAERYTLVISGTTPAGSFQVVSRYQRRSDQVGEGSAYAGGSRFIGRLREGAVSRSSSAPDNRSCAFVSAPDAPRKPSKFPGAHTADHQVSRFAQLTRTVSQRISSRADSHRNLWWFLPCHTPATQPAPPVIRTFNKIVQPPTGHGLIRECF